MKPCLQVFVSPLFNNGPLLLPDNGSCGKVMFSLVSACSQGGQGQATSHASWDNGQQTQGIPLWTRNLGYPLTDIRPRVLPLRSGPLLVTFSGHHCRPCSFEALPPTGKLSNGKLTDPFCPLCIGCVLPALYRMVGGGLSRSRVSVWGVSVQGVSVRESPFPNPPPPQPAMDRQTPVKLSPYPKLRLRAITTTDHYWIAGEETLHVHKA